MQSGITKKGLFCPFITNKIAYLQFIGIEEAETATFWHKALEAQSIVRSEKQPQLKQINEQFNIL